MIKVGVLDADSPLAGEIIRLLVNHPETEITTLYAPNNSGRNVESIHHGLIGETSLFFSNNINLKDIDFLISTKTNNILLQILESEKIEDLKWTSLTKIHDQIADVEIGLSEINRKALVRGAKGAFIPSPVVVPSLIALIPLASFLLLNSDLNIEVSVPEDMYGQFNSGEESQLIVQQLKKRQNSFSGKVNLSIKSISNENRIGHTKITLDSNLSLEEVKKVYDKIYDDHNFTFVTGKNLTPEEVEGTQKTLINLNKPDTGSLQIDIMADVRMRGGAGDVVHVMNLLFGLHEKTGLTLKSSRFGN